MKIQDPFLSSEFLRLQESIQRLALLVPSSNFPLQVALLELEVHIENLKSQQFSSIIRLQTELDAERMSDPLPF